MTRYLPALLLFCLAASRCLAQDDGSRGPIHPLELTQVKIHDNFWSPKFRIWDSITVYDVLNKLEGDYVPDRQDLVDEKASMGRTRNVLVNFDAVARGDKNTGAHDGPPWYDGLLYETIRGAADLLIQYPDKRLEAQIDRYIDHIAAAQTADPNGYLETYTTLVRPDKRWGTNGGDDKWQHDIYNGGMLVEAAVHYYRATGKIKLLVVAVKMANYMSSQMGPAPRLNVIPGHGGPEEALLQLYQLFKTEPSLAGRLGVPVQAQHYYDLATYWITNRGNYGTPGGPHSRKSDSSYNQDQAPVFQQTTIEGHAVRATLLATGVTEAALESGDVRYANAAERYWDNMIGKRMFVTGGEGAIADGERFGPDYFLPESAYLETCASIGGGFFSERMNELEADGKYMDAFERVIYNNLLSGISLDGSHYFYENPLKAVDHVRWAWHSCPCCPPMILKMVGALPRYIYGYDNSGVYVNLFIGNSASFVWQKRTLGISESTNYPLDGTVTISLAPAEPTHFALHVRIPGWAMGEENPYGLYSSRLTQKVRLLVNGESLEVRPVNGYAVIDRVWQRGDKVDLVLPMRPRVVVAADSVTTLKGMLSLASGPLVYALEATDNSDLSQLAMSPSAAMQISYQGSLLGGVNTIKGTAIEPAGGKRAFTAVPFYRLGNRVAGSPYEVWVPIAPDTAHITIDAAAIRNTIPPTLFGSCMEDVNHEIYGGLYAQQIMGESFEEPASGINYNDWTKHGGYWAADREYGDGSVSIVPGRRTRRMVGNNEIGVEPDETAKLVYNRVIEGDAEFSSGIHFLQPRGAGAGLILRASDIGIGEDQFVGYEVRINRETSKLQLIKHERLENRGAGVVMGMGYKARVVKEVAIPFLPDRWYSLGVRCKGDTISCEIAHSVDFHVGTTDADLEYVDDDHPILRGHFGLATAGTPASFRDPYLAVNGRDLGLSLTHPADLQVSDRWDVISSGPGDARLRLTQRDVPVNGHTAQEIRLIRAGGKAGVANRGLNRWGIALVKGGTYSGSCFLRLKHGSLPVTVALESADGRRTYARQNLVAAGVEWREHFFSLTATSSDPTARFAIYIERPGTIDVDKVSLFPPKDKLYKNLPLRADIAKALSGEGLTFMRYGGTMVNAAQYRFNGMTGPAVHRTPYTGHWNEFSSNGFGIPEFLDFCEAAHITPAFAINIEEEAQEASGMVEYLNGDTTGAISYRGGQRASDGHPAPYNVRYIEIGNEEVLFEGDDAKTTDHYIERFLALYDAIHSHDSSIKLIISAWWRPESANTEKIFRALDGKAAFWDLHVGGDEPGSGREVDQSLTRMQALFHKWDPATTMRCTIFEENGGLHNMQRALGHATNLNAVRRHGDFVLTACPANALQPWLQNDNGWDQGQIFFTPDTVWGMPPYYVQQLAAANYLPLRVYDTTEGPLDVTATRDEAGKTLILHIVNTTGRAIDADIAIGHFSGSMHLAKWTTIAAPLAAENMPGVPAVRPVEETLDLGGKAGLRHTCAPYSYSVVRFGL